VIPNGPRLGDEVVVAEHLAKGYGDRLLIDDLSFRLPRGGIVGVIGPNGAGKTTLFRMITGQEAPDSGTLKVGATVSWRTWTRAATRWTARRPSTRRSPGAGHHGAGAAAR
jgi:ABC-type multidrug transport system ATPase subunit